MINFNLNQKGHTKPRYFLIMTLSSIFVAEALVMFLLDKFGGMKSNSADNFIDSMLLALLLTPILYYLSYKPLKFNLNKLEDAQGYLEKKVAERTKDLTHFNQLLQQEISERAKIEGALSESEERYRRLVEFCPDGIAVHRQGFIEYANNAALKIIGLDNLEQVKGKPIIEYIHPDFREMVLERAKLALNLEKVGPLVEEKFLRPDGKIVDVELASSPINLEGEKAVLVVFRDITERKRNQEIIYKLAFHDTLTSLPNRRLLNKRLMSTLARARKEGHKVAALFIDIDELKNVNDTMGHATGDELLKAFCNRMEVILPVSATLGRWGGDEFTLVLPITEGEEEISVLAETIIEAFNEPLIIGSRSLYVTPSIGIAMYPDDGRNIQDLIKNADTAMYRAKELGGNTYQFYTSSMNDRIVRKMNLLNNLRNAVNNEEFLVHYQPVVNVHNQEIVGLEALIRWEHPGSGIIPPMEFISAAEESGLIVPIGEWVLRQACIQNKKWQEAGHPPVYVSVNLSALQFRQPQLVETITGILAETGLEPRFLRLEITESTAMKDIDFTIVTLKRLQKMGIKILIDDFGTGHSSLNYLKRFPVSTLKIDQSFIKDIAVNSEDQAIVSSVINLAQNLNLEIIAEGVETIEQFNILRAQSCCNVQGYLFSRPLPASEIEALIIEKRQVYQEAAPSLES